MPVKLKRKNEYLIKIILLIFIIASPPIINIAHSQEINLEKKITIVTKETPLSDILREIEQKGQIHFSYSSQLIDAEQKLSLVSRRKKLSVILLQLFTKANIDYIEVEKQIILKPKKEDIDENSGNKEEPLKFTFNGYLKDSVSGEALIGANITVMNKPIGTVTNSYGFFSITLPAGFYTFEFSYLGYQSLQYSIHLNKDIKTTQNLKQDEENLEVIVITGKHNINNNELNLLKKISITPFHLSTKVGLSGGADIIQLLRSIPGIQAQSDGSVFFFTRGGNKDQNLILVDDAPIYNPSHLFGYFSTISPDAINEASIYKNNFPLQYGGRLSSIVDIRTKDGNLNNFALNGNFTPFTKSIGVEGPIIKDKASYFVSFRNSHVDWINNLVSNNQRTDFTDFYAKLNYRINPKNRIYFSFYRGTDNIKQFETGYSTFAIKWQNFASTLRWNHLFSPKLFSNMMIYTSLYDYYLYTSVENNQYWNSLIGNISIKSDFTYYFDTENTLRFGLALNNHYFNPGNLNDEYFTRKVSASSAIESILYLGHEYRPNKSISLNYGMRLINWNNLGPTVGFTYNNLYNTTDTIQYGKGVFNTYISIEPRIDLNFSFYNSNSIKLSYNRNVQNLHLLSNSLSPFTTLDIWMPSGPNIKPQKMNQWVFAYNKIFTEVDYSIETFYKQMFNQIEYAENASMLLNPFIESQLRFGKSHSYGFELTLQKRKGSFTGIVNYCYSRVFNKIKDINSNTTYSPYYDKPHQINISLSYKASERWRLNLNWIYSSGSRFSAPSSFYYYNGYLVPFFGKLNNAKLPNYHRLDISATFRINKDEMANFSHSLSFTIVNLYGRKNPISVNFNKVEMNDGNFVVPANYITENQIIPTSIYLLGIAPSISYKFSFRTKK